MTEIYSRKSYARIGACVVICLITGMAVSFVRGVVADAHASKGTNVFLTAVWSVLFLTFCSVMLYGAIRALMPRTVDGVLAQVDGQIVTRVGNQLVIRVEGRNYKFPLSSDIDRKLNDNGSKGIRVRMEVGAFSAPLSLEIRRDAR